MSDDFRLRQIEASLDIQAGLVTGIQAELIKADQLGRSIDRLGTEASALAQALLQVAKQQQQLARLDSELKEVDAKSVKKDDLAQDLELERATQAQVTLDFRKDTLRRIYQTGIIVILILAITGGFLVDGQVKARDERYRACLQRAAGAEIVRAFANSQIEIEKVNRFVDNDLREKRFKSYRDLIMAFPIPDCEAIK